MEICALARSASHKSLAVLRSALFYVPCSLVLLFLLAPLFVIVPVSFTDSRYLQFPPPGYSLRWYHEFVTSAEWIGSLWLSLRVAVAASITATVLGTLSAYVMSRAQFPFKDFVGVLLLSPMIVAVIVLAVGFYFFFAKMGLLESSLGLVLAHTVIALPFAFICVLSVLEELDQNLEIAAMGLGATRFHAFRKITFPLIKPGILAGAIVSFIVSFDEIVIAIFICGTGAVTLPKRMWDGIRFEIDPTIAAVSTCLFCCTTLSILLVNYIFLKRERRALPAREEP